MAHAGHMYTHVDFVCGPTFIQLTTMHVNTPLWSMALEIIILAFMKKIHLEVDVVLKNLFKKFPFELQQLLALEQNS